MKVYWGTLLDLIEKRDTTAKAVSQKLGKCDSYLYSAVFYRKTQKTNREPANIDRALSEKLMEILGCTKEELTAPAAVIPGEVMIYHSTLMGLVRKAGTTMSALSVKIGLRNDYLAHAYKNGTKVSRFRGRIAGKMAQALGCGIPELVALPPAPADAVPAAAPAPKAPESPLNMPARRRGQNAKKTPVLKALDALEEELDEFKRQTHSDLRFLYDLWKPKEGTQRIPIETAYGKVIGHKTEVS